MNSLTYNQPNSHITENGIELPTYLGLGMLDMESIIEIDNEMLQVDYYEQCNGHLTRNLVYKIAIGKDGAATIYRYFNNMKYVESSEKSLELAFFRSFNLGKEEDGQYYVTEDKPLFQFANDVNEFGVMCHLWSLSGHLFFPAGQIIELQKPLIDVETTDAWERVSKEYDLVEDNHNLIQKTGSPFHSIQSDGTASVFPVFLKDALVILEKENLIGNSKNSALRVFYA